MSDCICNGMVEIKGFGGYGHYESTLKAMEKNVTNGYFRKLKDDDYEITYHCTSCLQLWKLGMPDFPIVGYFHKESK